MQRRLVIGVLVAVGIAVVAFVAVNLRSDETPAPTTIAGQPEGTDSPGESSTTPDEAPTTVPATGSDSTAPSSTFPEEPPPTTLPPVDDPDLGTGEDRPVPLGESVDVGDWRIGVSEAVLDATELVLDTVDFNEPPADGNQYLLVELTGIFQGTGPALPVFEWKLVSPDETFVPEGLECGVIPNSIYDLDELGNGEDFTGSICFEVPSEAVDGDLLLSLGLFDAEGREKFFSLE